jgi:hypothetical protein
MLPSAHAKMHRIRLTFGALVVGACACTSNADKPTGASANPPSGSGGATSGVGGDAMGGSGPSTSGNNGTGGALGVADGATVDALGLTDVFVVRNDAPPARTTCTGDIATLGSSQLVAGLSTPSAFADAYNQERATLEAPGPFLLALTGVNENVPGGWTAMIGPLGRASQGAVTFSGPRAQVSFTLGVGRAVDIAQTAAPFDLAFVSVAGATLPVSSIEMSGTLANACSSLTVQSLKLLIPDSAAGLPFHGSTVGALMGSALGPWPLELSGLAQQVYAVGVVDGGAEP